MFQVPTQQLTATPLPTPTLRQAPLKHTLLPLLAIGQSLLKGSWSLLPTVHQLAGMGTVRRKNLRPLLHRWNKRSSAVERLSVS
jgi:hypothetical protein